MERREKGEGVEEMTVCKYCGVDLGYENDCDICCPECEASYNKGKKDGKDEVRRALLEKLEKEIGKIVHDEKKGKKVRYWCYLSEVLRIIKKEKELKSW